VAKRRNTRNLVPLALLGVLTVGAAVAAAAAGLHQHEPVPASSTTSTPAVLQAAETATNGAGSAEFLFTSSTSGVSGSPASSTRGFGRVNFSQGTADAYLVTTSVGQAGTAPIAPLIQQISTPRFTYEKVSGTGASSTRWIQIPRASVTGPLAGLADTQAGGALAALAAWPAGATLERVGTAAVSGVVSTGYKVSVPAARCSAGKNDGSVITDSVLTVWIDAHHRIRRVQQQTFEKILPPDHLKGSVGAFSSTITLSDFGRPVTIATPTSVVKSKSAGVTLQVSGAQCRETGWVAYAPLGG
jgi:hypothetical protein